MIKINGKALEKTPESFFVPENCVFKSKRSVFYVESWDEKGWDLEKEFRYITDAMLYKHERQRVGRLVRITDKDGCQL